MIPRGMRKEWNSKHRLNDIYYSEKGRKANGW